MDYLDLLGLTTESSDGVLLKAKSVLTVLPVVWNPSAANVTLSSNLMGVGYNAADVTTMSWEGAAIDALLTMASVSDPPFTLDVLFERR